MDNRASTHPLAKGLRLALIAVLLTGFGLSAIPFLPARAAPGIIYVRADATRAEDGPSWGDAYTDLPSALVAADRGDEVWVAPGTYRPTTGTDRAATYQLRGGVGLYGGFAGWEAARNQRDWEANVSILSGDIRGPGNSDNSYHVVTASGADDRAVLNGFSVTGGNAHGDSALAQKLGGGVYNYGGSPTLANCTFSRDSAYGGAGMYNWAANPSSPAVPSVVTGPTGTAVGCTMARPATPA